MAFGKINGSRNRNSWGPMSMPTNFHRLEPDEEYAEEYTERMMSAQMRQLDPLKEDLADWLNKTLAIDYINRHNFLSELDNGVVLCHLAQIICEHAKSAISTGLINKNSPIPYIRGKCFEKAMRRSFFSRDNMENFIKFCRSLGVHDNLLFESDDLVLHNQPRNVILCLLEVARLATRYGIEPPGLIQLEKEILAEEAKNNNSNDNNGGIGDGGGGGALLSWQFQATPPRNELKMMMMRQSLSSGAISSSASLSYDNKWKTGPNVHLIKSDKLNSMPIAPGASDGVPSDNTEDEWSRGSGEDPDLDVVLTRNDDERNGGSGGGGGAIDATTELDRKVQLAARLMQKNCNCANGKCSKLRVKKVGEGKYNIAGKNVFVRLLKGRHMMVRVGGGWDTLDHFLLRHDPCQVKVVSRDSPDRPPASASKFLHIRAKYRSPPPRESVTR